MTVLVDRRQHDAIECFRVRNRVIRGISRGRRVAITEDHRHRLAIVERIALRAPLVVPETRDVVVYDASIGREWIEAALDSLSGRR